MPLIMSGLTIQGSLVATRAIQNQMLEFVVRHQIRPLIEKFPMSKEGIEKAFERLGKGEMRYRGVLVAQD